MKETLIQNIQKHYLKYLYFILFIFSAFLVYVVYQIFIPNKYIPTEKKFSINKDETGQDIFIKLKQEGFIKSVFWAKVTFQFFEIINRDKFFRGEYLFEESDSLYRILSNVTTRPPSLAVLIPPGFTKQQIADRISKYVLKFDKNIFLENVEEGYLFPDTYFFYSFSTTEEVIDELEKRYNNELFLKFGRLPTKKEVIVASMLEREARDPQDMKIIAGIIENRLADGMKLQIDATVLYGKGAWKSRVYHKDLLHESDYNTYLNFGLPVGPISNPGLDALSAAIKPAKTKYFFYLTGRDGKMYYSESGSEHVQKVAKYLR